MDMKKRGWSSDIKKKFVTSISAVIVVAFAVWGICLGIFPEYLLTDSGK